MTTKELDTLKIYIRWAMPGEFLEALRSAIELIEKQYLTADGVIVTSGDIVYTINGVRDLVDKRCTLRLNYCVNKCFSTKEEAAIAAAKNEG